MLRAQTRMQAGATIVPVIGRPCLWQMTWIGKGPGGLQVLPLDGQGRIKPVSAWDDRSEVWNSLVAMGILDAISARQRRA